MGSGGGSPGSLSAELSAPHIRLFPPAPSNKGKAHADQLDDIVSLVEGLPASGRKQLPELLLGKASVSKGDDALSRPSPLSLMVQVPSPPTMRASLLSVGSSALSPGSSSGGWSPSPGGPPDACGSPSPGLGHRFSLDRRSRSMVGLTRQSAQSSSGRMLTLAAGNHGSTPEAEARGPGPELAPLLLLAVPHATDGAAGTSGAAVCAAAGGAASPGAETRHEAVTGAVAAAAASAASASGRPSTPALGALEHLDGGVHPWGAGSPAGSGSHWLGGGGIVASRASSGSGLGSANMVGGAGGGGGGQAWWGGGTARGGVGVGVGELGSVGGGGGGSGGVPLRMRPLFGVV
ncbi:hypothetical protein FOA52_012743 [Chlamydomonas sp. UWO 241]|nr:hypothetical protein FOA52_012743 [Chlamydomonas sp. UWO 241]